jgi:hypothetical protein
MLLDFDHGGRAISGVPFQPELGFWKRRIGTLSISASKAEIHRMLGSGEVHTTSWMPGRDWTGTPFDPIYLALNDEILAAKCFGLLVMECVLERSNGVATEIGICSGPEDWGSGHYEKEGYPIKGRTYFRLGI